MDEPTAPGAPIRVAAPAKLNLYLHVLGRRADGYHELDSLVAFADAHDTVEVRAAPSLAFAVDGPMAPALEGTDPADNLVVRAARLLAEALGRRPDVAIRLTKRLPVASGIGGGSADAAACLRALARLWGLDPADARLGALAPRLGADVPVCLAGRAAYFGGIGDRLDPAPALPDLHGVLVNPGVPLSTPAVFRARTGPFSAPARLTPDEADPAAFLRALAVRGNDLAAPARALAPAIGDVLAALESAPGCRVARVSGSGATCFGLFDAAGAAETAARRIAAARPEWWVVPSKILTDVRVSSV